MSESAASNGARFVVVVVDVDVQKRRCGARAKDLVTEKIKQETAKAPNLPAVTWSMTRCNAGRADNTIPPQLDGEVRLFVGRS